jgi:hypothetical protein
MTHVDEVDLHAYEGNLVYLIKGVDKEHHGLRHAVWHLIISPEGLGKTEKWFYKKLERVVLVAKVWGIDK